MSLLNPSGRLSKVDKGDRVFQIQTEFYHRPRRKITTTVILDGKMMNKVETTWKEELHTDEDMRRAERALRWQHQRVIQSIENQGKKRKPGRAADLLLTQSWKELSQLEGIEDLVVMNTQGEVLRDETDSGETENIIRLVRAGTRLAHFLSQSTNVGGPSGGRIVLQGETIAWVSREDRICIARLRQKMGWELFLEKARQVEIEGEIE